MRKIFKNFVSLIITFVFCIFCSFQVNAYNEKTTQQAIQHIHTMLNKFDSFKDSEIFKKCGFGCSNENPAKKWAIQCKILYARSKNMDVAMPIYINFEYLLTMGRDYYYGNIADATEMRQIIEESLKK